MIGKARLPLLAGLATALLILFAVASSGTWLYLQASSDLQAHQRKILANAAATAAELVDPGLHATFTSPAQETTAAYLDAVGRLERVRAANPDIKYIYTCVLEGDSVRFVLDPAPAGDHDGDGMDDKSHIRQPYPDAGPACLRALRTGRPAADPEPYSDAWGTFVSAYAPFFDAAGRPAGVVGVDMEIGRSLGELRGMRRAAGYGFLIALVLAAVAGAGVALAVRWRLAADALRQRTLDQLAEEKARAEEAMRAKGDFLATMSHEIRTPLGAILGMLDLMLDRPMEAAQEQLARTARRSGEHLLSLLNDLLDLSKLEAGRIDIENIPFEPEAVFRDAVALLRGRAEEKGLRLAFRAPRELPPRVTGDPRRLRQVLINLVGNAVKFTEEGGVEVVAGWEALGAGRGLLAGRVIDTGIGIPPEKQGLLFRMFSQADVSTNRKYGGTGLGLAISRRLLEAMGGTIHVESRPGEGAEFRFTVPLATAPESPGGPEADQDASAVPESFRAPRLPILVAEDHPVNRLVACQTLERLGCRVECAVDGREALAKAASGDYAAVLMDIRMPDLDGCQAARSIRALPGPRGRVPIVAVTANSEDAERRRSLEAGMDAFLTKPLRRRELAQVLARWTPGGGAVPAARPPAEVRGEILEGISAVYGEPDPRFLGELVRLYVDAAPRTLAELSAALGRGDLPGAASAFHSLAGASLQMGATTLAAACRRAEDAAADGDGARVSALLPEVEAELSRVVRELRLLGPGERQLLPG